MAIWLMFFRNVSSLDTFYEYQLYCKSLYASIQKFTKHTMKQLKNILKNTSSNK